MSHEILLRQLELGSEGKAFVVVGVLRTAGPTAIKAGSKALILEDGSIDGWVGGHCTEGEIVTNALQCLKSGATRLLDLTTCQGGRMDVYLEPYMPKRRLVIFGHVPIVEALSRMAKTLDFHVTVVDKSVSRQKFPDADALANSIDQWDNLEKASAQRHSYAVVATMGEFDEDLVTRLAGFSFAYIGVIAGKRRASQIFAHLKSKGVPSESIARVRAPAGIYIRAVTAEEIALSIMAEIIEVARKESGDVREYSRKSFKAQSSKRMNAKQEGDSRGVVAIDPVCGMSVDASSSPHFSPFENRMIHFCCKGCKESFDADPTKYLLEQNH